MVELLTEQIAGLYDPKAHEFYVADWIPVADQKMVMSVPAALLEGPLGDPGARVRA